MNQRCLVVSAFGTLHFATFGVAVGLTLVRITGFVGFVVPIVGAIFPKVLSIVLYARLRLLLLVLLS